MLDTYPTYFTEMYDSFKHIDPSILNAPGSVDANGTTYTWSNFTGWTTAFLSSITANANRFLNGTVYA